MQTHVLQETHDALTGLPNRRCVDDLVRALDLGARSDLVLVLIDLPCLADGMRKTIAQRLRACARSDDMLARLGDDRFALLLTPRLAQGEEEKLLGRLRTAIGAHVFGIAAEFGIARCPEDGTSLEQLLAEASQRLRSGTTAH